MLRSEEMEKISLYFGRENIKKNMERIGRSGLLQIEDCTIEGEKRPELFENEFSILERLEQRLNYLKQEVKPTATDINESISFDIVREEIDKYYSRLSELKRLVKDYAHTTAVSEENYKMAKVSQEFVEYVSNRNESNKDREEVSKRIECVDSNRNESNKDREEVSKRIECVDSNRNESNKDREEVSKRIECVDSNRNESNKDREEVPKSNECVDSNRNESNKEREEVSKSNECVDINRNESNKDREEVSKRIECVDSNINGGSPENKTSENKIKYAGKESTSSFTGTNSAVKDVSGNRVITIKGKRKSNEEVKDISIESVSSAEENGVKHSNTDSIKDSSRDKSARNSIFEDKVKSKISVENPLPAFSTEIYENNSNENINGMIETQPFIINFDFISCIVDRSKKFLIKKILKQKLRRNLYMKMIDVELSYSSRQKTALIVYVLSEEAAAIVKQIVETMEGRVYNSKDALQQHKLLGIRTQLKRVERLYKNAEKQVESFSKKISERFGTWSVLLKRERKTYEALNKLSNKDGTDYLIGEAWIPRRNIEALQQYKSFDNKKGRFYFETIKACESPPTFFSNSVFSQSFQDLTNVFGVPKYREINPAIFLIFTFPFMFGAMFGDVLHGLILLFIAVYMILKFEKLNNKCGVLQIILNGRYVMLTCGIASIWFGFLYGDFGSMPIALFKSQYEIGRIYPFGIDPAWHHAENKMVFINSLKMKLSLIIGFVHMSLGALIAILNSLHFNDRITLVCTAFPQFISFTLFLGYLVFLCIYKWLVTSTYPSIVNTLIGMYTDPFNIREPMYHGQIYVQLFIFSTLLFSIPWMFFSKPVYMIMKRRIPKEGMLDLWINSGIHVVEFGLGLISNTSSYLRLWAVSLAHVQLTSVLHQFTIGSGGWIVAILTSPIYIVGTLMLLIGLEGLSACLHALRLNWIEFFSKFYSGCGIKYEPFSYSIPHEEIYDE